MYLLPGPPAVSVSPMILNAHDRILGAAVRVFEEHGIRGATTRFVLEPLRADNWTFFGVPMAMIVSVAVIVLAVIMLVLRHRADTGRPAAQPAS